MVSWNGFDMAEATGLIASSCALCVCNIKFLNFRARFFVEGRKENRNFPKPVEHSIFLPAPNLYLSVLKEQVVPYCVNNWLVVTQYTGYAILITEHQFQGSLGLLLPIHCCPIQRRA